MKFDHVCLEFTGSAHVTADLTGGGSADGVDWAVQDTADRFVFSLHAERETELHSVRARFSFPFEKKMRLFLNGYQSWTDSREHAVETLPRLEAAARGEKNGRARRILSGKLHSIDSLPRALVERYAFDRYGDYGFVTYGKKMGQLHGFSYAYIRRGEEYLLLGSLSEESGFTVIRFDTDGGWISLEKDCRGHHFTGDYRVFDLAILRGTENEVFDRWFALMGVPKPRGKRIFGYTSWYNLYENISEQSVTADLAGFAASEKQPDVFQIDDGYEQAVGDWLLTDEKKFPSGMAAAAEKIRAAGMTPGIWLAPFAAEKKSRLAKEHPDWLLKGKDGQPVIGGGNWSGFYALDIYHEGVREYLRKVFDTVIGKWGYSFVKLDFLYAACIQPRRDKTRAQVMYDGMRLLRELCGEAWILGCGVPLAPAFGLVDYCRIGCDVSLSWNDALYMRGMHRERVSTKNTVLNTVFRRQLNGRAFLNDPDVFLLREKNIRLTAGQKRILATVNALFGGVLFTSDNVSEYSAHSRKMYDELLSLSREDFISADLHGNLAVVTYRRKAKPTRLFIPL